MQHEQLDTVLPLALRPEPFLSQLITRGNRVPPLSGVIGSIQAAASGRFFDAIQAAAYLGGMNSRTLTRWAREGYLPAYPIGEGKRRLWRFLEHDLEQWMLARRTGTLATATDAPIKEIRHDW